MDTPAGEAVFSVTQLNRQARLLLEEGFPLLWVTGEISNLARPASGHLYFSLKDEQAQVRCAMFRGAGRGLRFRPENGHQVLARARVSLYEARGEYQLIIEHLEPAGDGVLLRRLEELKKRLALEGLFDERRKKALPGLPRRVGVITSPTGAAVRDILNILRRRFPAIPVVIYPVQVQGEQARTDIVAALRTAAARNECDVLILARGGGSLEDLWAFNEEIVARAIHACPIPVVSGVGHETDITIADFVADVRAPTPSGAAEIVAPDWRDWLRRTQLLTRRGTLASHRAVERLTARGDALHQRLRRMHPGVVLRQRGQRLDELLARLGYGVQRALDVRHQEASGIARRLRSVSPRSLLARRTDTLMRQRQQLATAIGAQITTSGHRFAVATASLQAFSPLKTLERGYAIVSDARSGKILRRSGELQPGQAIQGRLADGGFEAVVKKIS